MNDVTTEPLTQPTENEDENSLVITYEERGDRNIVRRSNQLVQLTRNNLTVSQQRLMLHIFAMIKPEDTELPTYEMSIYDFLSISGLDTKSGAMYRLVKKNIEELANAPVQWINQPGTENMETFRWIDKVKINRATGRMVLILDKALKPYLIQLKSLYTTLDIRYTSLMRSNYSVRIYELCKSQQNLYLRYKSQGKPLVWKVETLYEQLSYPSPKWGEFRRNALELAKREINGKTDIIFDYEPYAKRGKKVLSLQITIEPVSDDEAKEKLLFINDTVEKRAKKKIRAESENADVNGDDVGTVITLDYVSAPDTSIPYYYGKDKDALRHELDVKAKIDVLTQELSAEENNAVIVILDLIAAACCTWKSEKEMKDGGNVEMFNILNNVILEADGLESWLRGVASRYATHIIPESQSKKFPIPYLTKAIIEDLKNYRIYVFKKASTLTSIPPLVHDATYNESSETEAEETINQIENQDEIDEFVPSARAVKHEIYPEDADTRRSIERAIRDCINEEEILSELTTQGQREAYNDIIKHVAYLCRRNRAGKDDGAMMGKANMSFIRPLNSVLKKYGSLNLIVSVLAKKLDYDTFWDETAKNPNIKNPQAFFKYQVEQGILYPEMTIREFQSKEKKFSENTSKAPDLFNRDWNMAFDEDI